MLSIVRNDSYELIRLKDYNQNVLSAQPGLVFIYV